MKIFLDTAHRDRIRQWADTGLIDGVTTNPTHLSKEGGDPTQAVKDIAAMLPHGEISAEVTKEDPQEVYQQAHEIAKLAENIVVKVPCHPQYIPTIKQLVQDGIAVNVTLVFSTLQALAMAKLGVRFVSPFIGRLQDIGTDGLRLIEEIRIVFDMYRYHTQILAASTRSVANMHEVALMGADVVTVSVENFESSLHHPLTDRGMTSFIEDWKKLDVDQFPGDTS